MLSDDEILRRLRAIRFSPSHLRNARKAPSINALAAQAGLSRKALYAAANTGEMGATVRAKLIGAMTCHRNA